MNQRAKNPSDSLDLFSLENVAGGLSLAMLPATLGAYRQPNQLGTPAQYDDSDFPFGTSFGATSPFTPPFNPSGSAPSLYGTPSLYGASSAIGASSLGGALVHLNPSVATNVNAQHGAVVASSEAFNAARSLAQQTGGAVVFGGDLNRDGLIGAEDFLRSNRVAEGRAAAAVGQILDRVEAVGYRNGGVAGGAGGLLNQLPLGQILPIVGQVANWIFRSDGQGNPRPTAAQSGTPRAPVVVPGGAFDAAPGPGAATSTGFDPFNPHGATGAAPTYQGPLGAPGAGGVFGATGAASAFGATGGASDYERGTGEPFPSYVSGDPFAGLGRDGVVGPTGPVGSDPLGATGALGATGGVAEPFGVPEPFGPPAPFAPTNDPSFMGGETASPFGEDPRLSLDDPRMNDFVTDRINASVPEVPYPTEPPTFDFGGTSSSDEPRYPGAGSDFFV